MTALLPIIAFAKTWWKAIVGVIVVAPLIFFLGQCRGEKIGRLGMEAAIARANAETLKQTNRANEAAAKQRLTDMIAVNRQEQELINAIAATPDSAPDAVRIRLGCERLRRADGARSAPLPAACGPGGGAQAGPAR